LLAAVALDASEDSIFLVLLLLDQMFTEHGLELSGAVLTDFLTDHLNDLTDFLGEEYTAAVASAAWQTLLVNCRAEALEASDLFLLDCFFLLRNNKLAADFRVLDISFVLRSDVGLHCLEAVYSSILGFGDVLTADGAHRDLV